ncbi:RHS repeat protein [Shewanella psychropiezotolerans]|uniref:RHS repeat protein n=1 Tax=Shewanella psychropiezotolerans TaxID=2593655 RepID=A0ABX5X3Q9_9GAMM|nr:RHS repeat protein [Shewanella psychropiezotolerans]QDO85861.1 RHS repeat protein [Shewanella psychropiezotolerans]
MDVVRQLVTASALFVFITSFSAISGPKEPGGDEFSSLSGYDNDIVQSKMLTNFELTPLTKDSFGDRIDLSNGTVQFSYKDVSIPLNSQLDMSVKRIFQSSVLKESNNKSFGSAGWYLDIPHINLSLMFRYNRLSHGWDTNQECINLHQDQGDIEIDESWKGAILHVPDQTHEAMLYNKTSQGGRLVTKSNWSINCFARQDGKGQGFKAVSPNGVTYYFDIKQTINTGKFDQIWKTSYHQGYMYVSKVEDRFGNYINYEYSSDNSQLLSLKSNDGAVIRISYIDDLTRKIVSNIKTYSVNNAGSEVYTGKQWQYVYGDNIHYGKWLKSVILPNGSSWEYEGFGSGITYSPSFGVPEAKCIIDTMTGEIGGSTFSKVTHPNGAKATFERVTEISGFSNQPNFDNHVKAQTMRRNPIFKLHYHPRCFLVKRLKKKTIQNINASSVWIYDFEEGLGGFVASGNSSPYDGDPIATAMTGSVPTQYVDAINYRRVTVTRPDLSKTVSYVNRDYASITQGKTVYSEEYAANGVKLSSTYNDFEQFPQQTGTNFTSHGNPNERYKLNTKKVTYRNLLPDGTDTFYTDYSGYDQFGHPSQVKASSDVSAIKHYTKRHYYNDYTNWLIGLPTSRELSSDGVSWSKINESTYYSASGGYKSLPYQTKVMGKVLKKVSSYHADGNVKRVDYEGVLRYELFEDYYRGQARKVTLPCGITNGCNTANGSSANTMVARFQINVDGSTKSVTDFKGYKTSYSYNPVGWVTKVDYGDSRWVDKIISYSKVVSAGDGISGSGILAGQQKQVIAQAGYQKTIYYDAMLRKTLTRQKDTADSSSTSYNSYAFDFENRPTLQSFPSSSASNTVGMATDYDALGRVKTSTRQSDGASSTIEYLSGNKQRVTDAKGNVTTTTYLAYGSPSYDKPTLIQAPDSSNTSIAYNKFGQVTSISQGSVTEKRLYDGYQQLCKTSRPETGVTAYGYNAQRQPIWYAEGTNGGSSGCAASSVPASHKVLLGYDNLGQLSIENFPDATPDNRYRYDANGNLASLVSGSGSSTISWSYLYNSLNLIEKETLSMDSKSMVLDWGYNSLGAVSSLKYPSGKTISYSPNALGQPTKAALGNINYASNAKYHPNGQLKQLTYGNGLVRNVALDTTGRIDAISDTKGSSYLLRLDPSYDRNDNVAGLIDWVDRSNDIGSMSYDGLDRLKSADGKWGVAVTVTMA